MVLKGVRSFFSRSALSTLLLIVLATAVYGLMAGRSTAPGLVSADRRVPMAQFSAVGVDGKTWSLADHRGNVVLINFFATWCPPCNREMPGLVKTVGEYADKGVDAVAVSVDQGEAADVVGHFTGKYQIPFPVVIAGERAADATSDISSIPVTVLVDRQGLVAKRYDGMVSDEALKSDLDALLAERS